MKSRLFLCFLTAFFLRDEDLLLVGVVGLAVLDVDEAEDPSFFPNKDERIEFKFVLNKIISEMRVF